MSEVPKIIVAVGIAGLLLMVGAAAVIWSIRCSPKLPHYRLSALVAMSVPAAASIVWTLLKLA